MFQRELKRTQLINWLPFQTIDSSDSHHQDFHEPSLGSGPFPVMPLHSLQTSSCSAFDSPPVQEQQRIPEDRPNRKASSPKIWVAETTQVVMVVMIDVVNDKLLMITDCWWLNYYYHHYYYYYYWWSWWEDGNRWEWRLFHVAQLGIHLTQ